jgi:hypothetical protein
MRALTGVGPSIASGSHVCSGICADFATAPPSRPSATMVAIVPVGASANTSSYCRAPVCWISRNSEIAIVASPAAFMMNAFLAAATAEARSWLKPISR